MCIDVYDRYLDCEKDHNIETYHRWLKAHQYLLEINNDGCKKSRIIYCLITGPCPKCEFGSDCFDESDDPMEIDDEGVSDECSEGCSDTDSDEECWGTSSVTEAETSEPDLGDEWPAGF